MESSNSNSQERELYQLQQMQHKAKESCMKSFRLLQSHLQVLSYNDLKINGCFERAFATLFEQDVQTFTGIMLLNLDQLEKQLDKDEFQGDRSMAAFCVINKQFQMFIDTQSTWDYDSQMTEKYFAEYTGIEVKQFRETLLLHMGNVKKSLAERTRHKRHKTVEHADLKAQIQEKVFANVALKNELRKLKGNSMDTKFAKPSILGKPILQPPKNQSVVRQPNAFKSERPNFSKPRFASQVDVNNILSKPVTPHYLPKVREYVLAKPHYVIAPGSFRNSQEEPYGSNDMAHNHYLEEARKKTQERNRNSKPSVMHTTSLQNTTNGSKPNPRSNNQISRSLPVSKSSCGMSNGVSLVDHSRNSSSFSDSKHFVCSTCHKCVFNANHDNCITKFLKEVNSRAKVQSPKTRNNTKPVEPKSHTQKPSRQIAIGQRFSPKKSSAVHEKPNTPRSCLRWKPTGRIFKIAGLRWIPTGKMFTDYTTKVDSEPPNGSNDHITNPYECD
ncbi:hypothetical protein Tco_1183173 [Tanacetum coccineum]